MLGVVDLPTYLVGLLLIVLMPGPNSIYVFSSAARGGVRAGYRAMLGAWTGDTALMFLSAVGVSSLLRATPALFTAVKLAGALYLTWLAFGMLRSARALWRTRADRALATPAEPAPSGEARPRENTYRRAVVISLMNPKALLFFMAFFVQFVDPAYPHAVVPYLVLGALVHVFTGIHLSLLILLGHRIAARFRRSRRLTAAASAGVGAMFLAFATKLSVG